MLTLESGSASGVAVDPGYTALRTVKLGAVRAAFSPGVYERSLPRTFAALAVDVALYGAAIGGIFLFDALLVQLAFAVVAGCAVAFLFVWAHDAAHGALFTSDRIAGVLGTIAMLPSLNLYRLWTYGHNKVHHGFTSFSPIDWIWRPMTPDEYRTATRRTRAVYRVERSLPGCALHYVLRVWWSKMIWFRAPADIRRRYHFTRSRLASAAFLATAAVLGWRYAGGVGGVVLTVIVPWVVFNYFIALFIYLHHTHPTLPFFDDRARWSATIGQVACSTIVRTSRPVEWLTHGILLHTPHHVDTRIPFYRLPAAQRDLTARYGEHVVQYRFRWREVARIFRTCQLFDFERGVWHRFGDVRAIPAPIAAPIPVPSSNPIAGDGASRVPIAEGGARLGA
ncbi:MAG: fatty acid desaturase [Acidimicrobiia bacterium]